MAGATLFSANSLFAQDGAALSLDSLLNINVSTAARYQQSVVEAPASVTIVTAEQISRLGYRTLTDLLNGIRGFYLASDHQRTYLGVRGFNRMIDQNNRVLLLLNGHTLNESAYGSVPLGMDFGLDLNIIERVEIVRGPGSALYGTGALFAVINIITKTPQLQDGLITDAEIGSNGLYRSTLTYGKKLAPELDLFLSGAFTDYQGSNLYFEEFDQPETNNGLAEKMDWLRYYGGMARVGYKSWSAQAFWQTSSHGIPTGDFGSTFNDKNARRGSTRLAVELKRDFNLASDKSLSTRTYLDLTDVTLTFPISIALERTQLETLYGIRLNQQSLGGESIFQWDLGADNRLVVGAQFVRHFIVDISSIAWIKDSDASLDFFEGSFPYHQFSVFVQDEYQVLENLSLTLGLRQDLYSRAGSATTPRAALVYHPFEESSLKLLYGEAFRAPNSFEVNFSGPVERIRANPDLLPERIHTLELVWEQRPSESWSSSVSVYNYQLNNLIEAHDDPAEEIRFFDNIPGIHSRGVEFEIEYRPSNRFDAFFSVGYQATRRNGDALPVINSPAHLFRSRVQYSGLEAIDFAVEMDASSARFTNQGNTTPGFAVFNLHATSPYLFGHLRFQLSVFNALDSAYYVPGGRHHLQDRFLQEGRTIRFRISLAL